MSSPNSQTLDFDALVTTTLRKYLSTSLNDNIFNQRALFAWLKGKGRYVACDGGEYLVEPLLYGRNSTPGWMSGYDTIDTQAQDGITTATFNWKMIAGSVVISEQEKLKNSGTSKIIDLLEAKTMQLEESLRYEMNVGAFSDGTTNDSKILTGLRAMVAASGTYGGISRTTYTWWNAFLDSTAEALSVADMRNIYNSAGGGGKSPDFIMTTQTLFEAYEALAYGKLELNNLPGNPLADLGFQTLRFKGAIMAWDEDCPSGNMFMLNSPFIKLRYHPGADFKSTEKKQPTNQLAWVWNVYWMGNLTTGNCRRHGRLSGKTA